MTKDASVVVRFTLHDMENYNVVERVIKDLTKVIEYDVLIRYGCEGEVTHTNASIYTNGVRTMSEMIYKELAIDTIMSQPPEPHYPAWYAELIRNLSPVEPNLDEWCTDCKEYDSEHHCCPRFNRVIRETLKERSKDE